MLRAPCWPEFARGAALGPRTSEKRGAKLRRISNARTFQVEQQMVAGRDSAGHALGHRGLDQDRAAGSRSRRPHDRRAQGYRARQEQDRGRRPRRHRLPRMRFPKTGRHSAVASVEAVPGVRLVNDETRLVPEAKPFVWTAERDVVRVTLAGSSPLPASKGKIAGGGPRGARRRRGRRSDEFGAAARRRVSTMPRCCCSIRSAN